MATVRKVTARPDADYTIQSLSSVNKWTDRQLREEYTRLRDIARKRLDRISQSEFKNRPEFRAQTLPKLRDMSSRTELVHAMRDVSRFVMRQTSTVTGLKAQRDKTITAFRVNLGIDLKEKDFEEFGAFMEYMRDLHGERFDSLRAAELYEASKDRGISVGSLITNYDLYNKHWREFTNLKAAQPTHGKEGSWSSEQLRANVNLSQWYKKFKGANTAKKEDRLPWAKKSK